jgi:hypothetical protein
MENGPHRIKKNRLYVFQSHDLPVFTNQQSEPVQPKTRNPPYFTGRAIARLKYPDGNRPTDFRATWKRGADSLGGSLYLEEMENLASGTV